MAARTTRQAARERLQNVFQESLDRLIPPDESVPIRGHTFLEFENQVEAMADLLLPTALEERSALQTNARVERGACVPFAGRIAST
jgi:hypothetical protein